jgi:hypothetical protein
LVVIFDTHDIVLLEAIAELNFHKHQRLGSFIGDAVFRFAWNVDVTAAFNAHDVVPSGSIKIGPG